MTRPDYWVQVHDCGQIPRGHDVFRVTAPSARVSGLRPGWYDGDRPTYTVRRITACPYCGGGLP